MESEEEAEQMGPPGSDGGGPVRPSHELVRSLEQRFHSTVERVADGIIVVDPAGRILFTNPAGEQIFGRAAAELIGSELGLPLVSGESTTVDLHGPRGTRTAELRVVDTTWEDHDAFLISVRDITERREAEERERQLLREQLARVQAEEAAARSAFLAEATRVLVASMDQDAILCRLAELMAKTVAEHCVIDVSTDPGPGRYRRVVAARKPDGTAEVVECVERGAELPPPSPLALRLYETQVSERVASPGPEWLERAFAERDERELWRSLAPATVVFAPLIASSGPLGFLAAASPRPEALSGGWETVVAGVAHRIALGLDNARLLRLAEEASRAKSDFLAIISHELRTPLTGITGYAGLLMEELERPLTERERRYVDGILKSSDRLLGIIDQILLFARSRSDRQEVHYQPCSLVELVGRVVRVARPLAAEAGLALTVKTPAADVQVTTDDEMVRYILLHLLTNAIKFTDRGSVTLDAWVEDGRILLRVADTGRGIPQTLLERIFEPFSQAEPPHTRVVGGTGLGLNVAQNLVRALGGELRVESELGLGSTFTVSLPQPSHDAVSGTNHARRARRSGGASSAA